jgi:chaperone BCS1
MDGLITEITDFLSAEEDYHSFGIPYKKTFLFSGLPGTGKSSLIASVASHFKFNLASVSFTAELDDKAIRSCISNLPNQTFLVFEDIDSLFDGRDSTKNVSFSGFLNIIDGLCRINQLVIFMTTNYPKKLDSALLRPGRVDSHIEFGYVTKEQVKQAFGKYRPTESDTDFENFYSKVSNTPTTMCVFQKFFFKYRNEKDKLVKNIKELNKFIDEYHQQEVIYFIH